jgi:hypothetical protein
MLVAALAFIGASFLAIKLTTVGRLAWPLACILLGGTWGGLFGFVMDQLCIPLTRRYLREAREAGRKGADGSPGVGRAGTGNAMSHQEELP